VRRQWHVGSEKFCAAVRPAMTTSRSGFRSGGSVCFIRLGEVRWWRRDDGAGHVEAVATVAALVGLRFMSRNLSAGREDRCGSAGVCHISGRGACRPMERRAQVVPLARNEHDYDLYAWMQWQCS
jgi:hypothetical protein